MPQTILSQIEPASSFEIKIDFEKHSDHPSRVFESMAEMIKSFQLIDNDLLIPFDVRAEPFLILEDITTGSLKTRLTTMLHSVDDEALKSGDWKKLVGSYLIKSKHRLINFLEDKKQITDRNEIQKLENDIQVLAIETEVKHLPSYKPVPLAFLLRDIGAITGALTPLKASDSAKFLAAGKEAKFNQSFEYHQDSVELLLTKEIKGTDANEVLMVKKPDYLGESMWEFRYRSRIIFAKIEDHNWLLRFQSRREDVRPGDSLSVILRTEISYGFQGEEIAIHHKVMMVEKIIPMSSSKQTDLIE